MASDTDIGEIKVALRQLTETIEDLLNYGRTTVQDSRGSVEEFVDSKIGKLFGFTSAYHKCLTRLGVKTKEEFENILHKHARNSSVRELSTELLDLEQEWDIFLSDVDKILADDCNDTVQMGQTGPINDNLVDDEISSANGKVMVITFGLREGALRWLDEMKCTFPFLIDQHRKLYHFFGLKRSTLKVWGVNSLVFYAEAMVAGRSLLKPYENIHDDPQQVTRTTIKAWMSLNFGRISPLTAELPALERLKKTYKLVSTLAPSFLFGSSSFLQMGGNFILDKHGITRFLYPSKTSMDRPEVELLLQELQKIH